MPKSRKRKKVKARKVYTHQRPRKEGNAPTSLKKEETVAKLPIRNSEEGDAVVKHSIEILKLSICKNHLKNQIAMCARCLDNMSHFIDTYKEHMLWFDNKISEHRRACNTKMKLFLGKDAEMYKLSVLYNEEHHPAEFHMSSTDLKNGYVVVENKKTKELFAIIMANINAQFPNDLISKGSIIPYDEDKLAELKINSLLKNEDVISTILLRKVSTLEGQKTLTNDSNWYCGSVSCIDRKRKLNFEDI